MEHLELLTIAVLSDLALSPSWLRYINDESLGDLWKMKHDWLRVKIVNVELLKLLKLLSLLNITKNINIKLKNSVYSDR